VSTDDEELYEVLKSIRSHGWDRDASEKYKNELRGKWNTSDFNSLYTFYHSGFNLRSTDLQAFIGLGQIDKLDDICIKRNKNYKLYQEYLGHKAYDRGFISSFAYPIISERKNEIVERLIKNDIQVRPMICGSMGTQPFYVKEYGRLELPNVSIIDKCGFYVPNHPDLTDKDIIRITDIIKGYK